MLYFVALVFSNLCVLFLVATASLISFFTSLFKSYPTVDVGSFGYFQQRFVVVLVNSTWQLLGRLR